MLNGHGDGFEGSSCPLSRRLKDVVFVKEMRDPRMHVKPPASSGRQLITAVEVEDQCRS